MEELRSVLVENFRIDVPGFRLRRLALNQHMPRVEKLSEHRHAYHQALLYLRGRGTQHFSDRALSVARGDWLVIPPNCSHRFAKEKGGRPVCLAIDFDTDDGRYASVRMERLEASQILEVERWLVELHAEEARPERPILAVSALSLRIVALLEAAVSRERDAAPRRIERRVLRVIEESEDWASPGQVAEVLGCSLDHLNRSLKEECGITVGGLIRRTRFAEAGHLLKTTSLPIAEIASRVGYDDQNYFGRWFRKYTGQTPSAWREAMRER